MASIVSTQMFRYDLEESESQTMKNESFETICKDGVILKGILLMPENPKAVIQFNCGTGTKKEVYLSFLTYLAENGYLCCLWDYRGSGGPSSDNLGKCDFTFSDYGIKDMPAIKSFLNQKFPNLPYVVMAHSAGGQQIGFMEELNNIKGVINFAVSSGYYPNMPLTYRIKAYFYFYVFAPISVLLTGYIKAKQFGLMEDLPKNVVYEWRDWLEKEDYFFDKKFYGKTVPIGQFKNYKFPIHTYWTADDTISNEKNTKAFWKHINSEKEISFTKLTPREFGLGKIDHFGFFKRVMKDRLWQDVVYRLNRLV
ncbi:alpha/beta hydrolase [Olivibacter sp. SDN3]|uniref:alpha/beta hydrolase family protein n=1 Tax=Olivibacter sp. SDN3 TaxID=2764720 RepID=UPI001650F5F0|nr:alpha/beta hydrolase [Olivibacter sp. SDN3]QNL51825.1 alpha/beta hydrolase [Olivibacter sp. SDN3]